MGMDIDYVTRSTSAYVTRARSWVCREHERKYRSRWFHLCLVYLSKNPNRFRSYSSFTALWRRCSMFIHISISDWFRSAFRLAGRPIGWLVDLNAHDAYKWQMCDNHSASDVCRELLIAAAYKVWMGRRVSCLCRATNRPSLSRQIYYSKCRVSYRVCVNG